MEWLCGCILLVDCVIKKISTHNFFFNCLEDQHTKNKTKEKSHRKITILYIPLCLVTSLTIKLYIFRLKTIIIAIFCYLVHFSLLLLPQIHWYIVQIFTLNAIYLFISYLWFSWTFIHNNIKCRQDIQERV